MGVDVCGSYRNVVLSLVDGYVPFIVPKTAYLVDVVDQRLNTLWLQTKLMNLHGSMLDEPLLTMEACKKTKNVGGLYWDPHEWFRCDTGSCRLSRVRCMFP